MLSEWHALYVFTMEVCALLFLLFFIFYYAIVLLRAECVEVQGRLVHDQYNRDMQLLAGMHLC